MRNTSIEFHDSTLGSISRRGDDLVLDLPHVFVFTSDGEPGRNRGVVWSQAAKLFFQDAEMPLLSTELPAWISDGRLTVGQRQIEHMLPVPLAESGEVELSLELNSGENLVVRCRRVELVLVGDESDHHDWPG